jgi:hypothetical protein
MKRERRTTDNIKMRTTIYKLILSVTLLCFLFLEGSAGAASTTQMTLQNYDGSSVPVNQAGETYPSFYGGAGNGTISLNSSDAVSGKSLQATLSSGYAQIQFNPYSISSRSFAREYVVNPSGWLFNTYDRMRFWIKVPQNQFPDAPPGQANYQIGTYVKRVTNPDNSSDETGGNHYYHHLNIPYTGQWTQVVLNMHPIDQRGGNGGTEWGNMPHPTGESQYNYFDALTRFYIDNLSNPGTYPATYLIDNIEFYKEPAQENDDQVYSIHGTYVPSSNRIYIGWMRNKDENSVNHEIRYAFSDIHQDGWSAATPAPNGVITPPGWQGYNGMVYDTTNLPLSGKTNVYIAIKPQNATLFSQVVIPLSSSSDSPPAAPRNLSIR